MLNPSYADELKWDWSSMRIINHLIELEEYGGVDIVNLFSWIEVDSKKLPPYEERYNKTTDNYLEEAIRDNKDIIIAWGSNKDRKRRINKVKKILLECESKHRQKKNIYRITDDVDNIKHISRLNGNIES